MSTVLKGPKEKLNCTMDDVPGYFLGPPHSTMPAAFTASKNIKVSSIKSSGNIQKKEVRPDCTVSNIFLSSVNLTSIQ